MDKKLKLAIELIPASSWNNNLRGLLPPWMWENLRKKVYKKHNFKCAICGAGGRLYAHEVWEYDDKNHIQKLKNLIALCTKCHAVKHIGYAGIQASEGKLKFHEIVKHFMKVNKCDYQAFQKHYKKAIQKFEERSHYEWQLNLDKLKDLNSW